jgi:penicillin-binding protein 1A
VIEVKMQSEKIKIIVKFLKVTLILSIVIPLFLVLTSALLWLNKSDTVIKNLDKYEKEINDSKLSKAKSVKILDKNGIEIGEFYTKNFLPIRKDNLDKHSILVWALLASEDRGFYEHRGINISAIFRAVFINLSQMKLSQGGSTITQQLAKISLDLGERTFLNKLAELFCTLYIEWNYDKKSILAMYLNQIYLGEGNNGMEAASKYYFNKSASELNETEAALLVGIIPAPSVYNPVKNLRVALKKQRIVMLSMAKKKELYTGKKQIETNFEKLVDAKITQFKKKYIVKITEEKTPTGKKVLTSSTIGTEGYDKQFKINLAPDFNESIRKFMFDKFPSEMNTKNLRVYTTLDIEKQKSLNVALKEGVDSVRAELQKRLKKYEDAKNEAEVNREKEIIKNMNGSAISIDPFTGNIEALIGAYKLSAIYRLNRAESSKRQPGSVIKALIYALALEKKIITPSTIVIDEKIRIGKYSPKNWYKGYKGQLTARQALALSVNTIPVKLLQEIGIDHFLQKLSEILSIEYSEIKKRMQRDLSLALGSGDLTAMELALVYSTIANGGYVVQPRKIIKILDDSNQEVYTDYTFPEKKKVIDSVACAMTINMLEAILSQEGTMPVTLKPEENFPKAGKTGTVQIASSVLKKWGNRSGVRDAWFAGMFPGIVTTIWIGNDQGAPFPGSGSGTCGGVWLKYAKSVKYRLGMGNSILPEVDGDHVKVDICGDNGRLLSVDETECKYPLYGQYYYNGEEPKGEEAIAIQPITFDEPINEGSELEESNIEPLLEDDNLINPYHHVEDEDDKTDQPFTIDPSKEAQPLQPQEPEDPSKNIQPIEPSVDKENSLSEVPSETECRITIEKVISKIEETMTDSQKNELSITRGSLVEKHIQECKEGKTNLECLKNSRDISTLSTCRKE